MVVFRGGWPDRFQSFKRATLGFTWNTEKSPKTPDGIILQTKALGLSLHHCRGKWDSHNCYHLLNPPSKSRSALQIKYLECLCSFSCIVVHHYSRWVRPKTPMRATQRKRSKKSVWHLKLQVSSLLNYTCGKFFFIKSSCRVNIHPFAQCAILIEILLQQSWRCRNIGCWILVENWVVVHEAAE